MQPSGSHRLHQNVRWQYRQRPLERGGGDGNDTVNFSYQSNNTVEGGSGNDLLQMTGYSSYNSSAASNTLAGGAGNDRMVSGSSADTYLFNRGDGQDTILDYDNGNYGKTDRLVFGAGITVDQLWLRRIGSNLEMSVIGTGESVTIENWYSSSAYHIEQFSTADNRVLLDSQVENLVQAMSAFEPPAAGQMALPQNYQDSLGAVIAANWK